jgi:hypothetical protein
MWMQVLNLESVSDWCGEELTEPDGLQPKTMLRNPNQPLCKSFLKIQQNFREGANIQYTFLNLSIWFGIDAGFS